MGRLLKRQDYTDHRPRDASLATRQTREKVQCLYENLMWNNFHKNGCSEKRKMTCKLKLQSKGNRPFLPKQKTPWRQGTLVHVQIEFALTVII